MQKTVREFINIPCLSCKNTTDLSVYVVKILPFWVSALSNKMKANLSSVWVCFNSGGKPNSVKEATDLKGERSYMFSFRTPCTVQTN